MLRYQRILILLCMAVVLPTLHAQTPLKDAPQVAADTVKIKRENSAWTLTSPLGFRQQADIDTILYNYQRQAIPSMQSDAYVTTGNLGSEGTNLLFFQRSQKNQFFFNDALEAWMPSFSKQKFYNVYIPMTLLSYNFGGGKETTQDRLRATFAGNANRRVGIGANMDYLYSRGSYNYQATKDYTFGFSGYYNGDRYEMAAFFNQSNMLNKENGGITDDRYITDPADVQGGVSKIEPKSIPTNLSDAHTRLRATEFFMTHAVKFGYWKDEVVNDTLTRQKYIPVIKFIYSLDYKRGRHTFVNGSSSEAKKFWSNTYLNDGETRDVTSYWSLANTFGVTMVEGFKPWAKFSLAAYAEYELRKFTQTDYTISEETTDELTPLPDNFSITPSASQNILWVGGRLAKESGALITYAADVKFGLTGDCVGDVNLNGEIGTRFKLLGDTVSIKATGFFRNTAQPYLLQHYISNHFAWDNDFGKTRSFRVGGELTIPWTNTTISAGTESMQNYVYFDSQSLPQQESGNIQIFSASLLQKLRFGIWNWDNSITFQTSSREEVLPLPKLTWYSNMYLMFKPFKSLYVQIGADCDYISRYNALGYQPATMSFYVKDDGSKAGNYAFCNVYATCKLYKVRFYVMFSHINQGWFGKEYFSMPGYPLNPRRFQLGLSIDFAN